MVSEKTDLYPLEGPYTPQIHPSCYMAAGAQVLGRITIQENTSIWFNAVLRADINTINIGANTNIQDGSVVHLENDIGCEIGHHVTIGHGAMIHACTIEPGVLVGMGAIILNGAVLKKGAVIGAGAVIKENQIVPENSLWVGIPAKQIKDLGPESYAKNIKWAQKYVQLAQAHQKGLFKSVT